MANRLSSEDQARVDAVIHSGTNDVERAQFRPWTLLLVIVLVLTALSFFSYALALQQGVV